MDHLQDEPPGSPADRIFLLGRQTAGGFLDPVRVSGGAGPISDDFRGSGQPNAGYAAGFAAILIAVVSPWLASGLYAGVTVVWVIPDRLIERVLMKREKS